MKIPEKIQLFGKEIRTVWNDNLCDEKKAYAEADFRKGIILVQKKSEAIERPYDFICVSYLHEVQHWIFHLLGYEKLRDDEDTVGRLSEMWYQAFKQIEGIR